MPASAATQVVSDFSPDTESLRKKLEASVSANAIVTAYCHALENVHISPLPNQAWFPEFQASLDLAKKNAGYWIKELQPQLFAIVPQALIDYSTTFQASTEEVLGLIAKITGRQPTDDERADIIELINAILDVLKQKKSEILDLKIKLQQFTSALLTDQNNLTKGKNSAQAQKNINLANVARLKGKIQELQTKAEQDSKISGYSLMGLGVSLFIGVVALGFIAATGGAAAPIVVGVIAAIGAVGGTAAGIYFSSKYSEDLAQIQKLKTEMKNEEMQAAALEVVAGSIEKIVSENEKAKKAMSDILDTWATLESKLNGVLDKLQQAEKADIGAALMKANIKGARTAWGQLVTYAEAMQSVRISVQKDEVKPAA